jgi:4-hydroxy-2-oxoheptanedioate aldolase
MLSEMIRVFRGKLEAGHVVGPFSKTHDPAFVEIMGYAEFDFVILDLEHGPNNVQTLQNLVRGAQVANILPIVRVKENNPSVIGEVLDIGAAGIQVPQIESADQARDVIRHARFGPLGTRGVCRFVRAADYSSLDRFDYFREANEAIIVLQIEGQQGIEQLDAILDVEGIDIIFIGPYDLSQSVGVPGQIENPIVIEKMMQIIETCNRRGIAVGTFVDNIQNARKWRDIGVKYISYSVDMGIFYEACSNIIANIDNIRR